MALNIAARGGRSLKMMLKKSTISAAASKDFLFFLNTNKCQLYN